VKVRPITVLAGLLALVAVGSVAVAWRGSDSTSVVQPAALPLALGGASYARGVTTTIYPDMARRDRVTYRRGPGLVDVAGTRAAWSLPAGEPDRSAVARLARALGVEGSVVNSATGFVVGDPNHRSLQVASQGGASWYLNDGGASTSSGAVESCATTSGSAPVTTVPSGAVRSAPASTTTVTGPVPLTSMPGDPPPPDPIDPGPPVILCEAPPAPRAPDGVPDRPAAEASARRLLADAGIDLTHATVSVSADAYSATVRVVPVLEGAPVDGVDTTVVFGAKGAVVAANGWLGEPARGDQYPLIGIDAAITRLQAGGNELGIQPMMVTNVPTTVDGSGPGAISGVIGSSPPPDSPVTTGTIQLPSSTTLALTPAGPGINEPPVPVLPEARDITITITNVSVILTAVPGTDGAMWLVPAYRLESADGGSWMVLAIDPGFIAPPPVPPAMPATSVVPVPSVVPVEPPSIGGSSTPGSAGSSGN